MTDETRPGLDFDDEAEPTDQPVARPNPYADRIQAALLRGQERAAKRAKRKRQDRWAPID